MKTQERISKIKTAIQEFEFLQEVFSDYGAWDSEPRNVFFDCTLRALNGNERALEAIPTTGEGWQLFVSSMNCKTAATRLAAKTRKLVRLILGATISERTQVVSVVSEIMGFRTEEVR